MPELEIGLTDGGKLNFNHFFCSLLKTKNKTKQKIKKKIQEKGSS